MSGKSHIKKMSEMSELYLLKENPYAQIEFDGELGWLRSVEFDLTEGLADFEIVPKAND